MKLIMREEAEPEVTPDMVDDIFEGSDDLVADIVNSDDNDTKED